MVGSRMSPPGGRQVVKRSSFCTVPVRVRASTKSFPSANAIEEEPCNHWRDSSQGSSSTRLYRLQLREPFEYLIVHHCGRQPVCNVESAPKHGSSPTPPNHHPTPRSHQMPQNLPQLPKYLLPLNHLPKARLKMSPPTTSPPRKKAAG